MTHSKDIEEFRGDWMEELYQAIHKMPFGPAAKSDKIDKLITMMNGVIKIAEKRGAEAERERILKAYNENGVRIEALKGFDGRFYIPLSTPIVGTPPVVALIDDEKFRDVLSGRSDHPTPPTNVHT